MAQNELVLKIPSSENRHMHLTEHHEAATNLNLDSHSQNTKSTKSKSDTSRGQCHSRESSGTSNLSVKFTIEREGIGGSSPSITESVSVCSSPQGLPANSNLQEYSKFSKPTIATANKNRNKKRRCRKSVESSGKDSGTVCGMSSANEDYSNTHPSEDGSLGDERTTMDELSDEGIRLQRSLQNNFDINDSKNCGAKNISASELNQITKKNFTTQQMNTCIQKNSNTKSDSAYNANVSPSYADISIVESQQHSCKNGPNR